MVVVDLAAQRILQFDADDIAKGSAVADDDVLALPGVDAGVVHAADRHPLDDHVAAAHGVDAIRARVLGHNVVEVNAL